MGEEPWSERDAATTWTTTDTLLKYEPGEADPRLKIKQITIPNLFAGNETGDLTIQNNAPGNKILLKAKNSSAVQKTLLTLNADTETVSMPASIEGYVTVTSDSDAIDVKGIGIIFVDTTGGSITVGGFVNGIIPQQVAVVKIRAANSLILENFEATGTEKLINHAFADLTFTNYGGTSYVFDGITWYECGY